MFDALVRSGLSFVTTSAILLLTFLSNCLLKRADAAGLQSSLHSCASADVHPIFSGNVRVNTKRFCLRFFLTHDFWVFFGHGK